MPNVRTITLEFLRKGPAHNQLLSPLTDYLAVLGEYRATTVNVPYNEHAELLSALQDLSYPTNGSQSRRQEVLNETANKIAEVLGKVDGFREELKASSLLRDIQLHMKFVISANELALLPFELAKMPTEAVTAAGTDWLALVSSPRVCISRQIRSITGEKVRWPEKPRILFVWAEPEHPVPKKEHECALLDALRPWIPYFDPKKSGDFEQAAQKIVTILAGATIKDIETACSEAARLKAPYTHVHILAHGYACSDILGSPVGIGLHSTGQSGKVDIIVGSKFAKALGPRLPTVVTVAACDTGAVRSVVHKTGVSFAHDLHQAGIPFVVASQFPLSVTGSIDMVEVLYKGLLWAEDPRSLLSDLRGLLHKKYLETHDWASLVAYTALPPDLENQLIDARYTRAKLATDAAMDHIDTQIKNARESRNVSELRATIPQWRTRVTEATTRMPLERKHGYETEGIGMLGSAEKRIAEALFNVCCISNASEQPEFFDLSIAALENSLNYYEKAFHANIQETRDIVRIKRSVHWVLCQYLSLCAVLGKKLSPELWGMARVAAQIDTEIPTEFDKKGEIRTWGHGTLWELYLLVLAYKEETFPVSYEVARSKSKDHVNVIRELGTFDDRFPIKSTRRQIDRYCKWWCHDLFNSRFKGQRQRDWSEKGGLKELAEDLAKLLPDN